MSGFAADAGKNTLKEVESKLIPQLDQLLYARQIVIKLWGKPIITIEWALKLNK